MANLLLVTMSSGPLTNPLPIDSCTVSFSIDPINLEIRRATDVGESEAQLARCQSLQSYQAEEYRTLECVEGGEEQLAELCASWRGRLG